MTVEGMEFCYTPTGDFALGDAAETYTLAYPYWIARFPITNAQFQPFVAANGYTESHYWAEAVRADFWKQTGFHGRYDSRPRKEPRKVSDLFSLANHPVVGVSWYEAVAYTRWLDGYLHQRGLLPPDWCVQLPSELEWEKAARGGLETPVPPAIVPLGDLRGQLSPPVACNTNPLPARLYPWGDLAEPDYANFERTEIGATNVVGCFPLGASPYGAEEMSGNVWEWTRSIDGEQPYPVDAADRAGRENLAAHAGAARVLRGGAYQYYEYFVRCAERYSSAPDDWNKLYGFRVVLTPFRPDSRP